MSRRYIWPWVILKVQGHKPEWPWKQQMIGRLPPKGSLLINMWKRTQEMDPRNKTTSEFRTVFPWVSLFPRFNCIHSHTLTHIYGHHQKPHAAEVAWFKKMQLSVHDRHVIPNTVYKSCSKSLQAGNDCCCRGGFGSLSRCGNYLALAEQYVTRLQID